MTSDQKVAIVTGGSSVIGRATAVALAREERVKVVTAARREKEGENCNLAELNALDSLNVYVYSLRNSISHDHDNTQNMAYKEDKCFYCNWQLICIGLRNCPNCQRIWPVVQ